jgi:hypothetical protein
VPQFVCIGGIPGDGESGVGTQLMHSRKLPVFPSKLDAALLMVKAEEAQWVTKAAAYLQLEAQAGVMDWAAWDLVQEETGV